ncbi:MAG: PepSY domain-containing protein [Paracoccaceae bacterium]
MLRVSLISLGLALSPLAALATPAVGSLVGTNPDTATAALEKAGCKLDAFEAEDSKIEAKCTDVATNKAMEIYIDPATGKVANVKSAD